MACLLVAALTGQTPNYQLGVAGLLAGSDWSNSLITSLVWLVCWLALIGPTPNYQLSVACLLVAALIGPTPNYQLGVAGLLAGSDWSNSLIASLVWLALIGPTLITSLVWLVWWLAPWKGRRCRRKGRRLVPICQKCPCEKLNFMNKKRTRCLVPSVCLY